MTEALHAEREALLARSLEIIDEMVGYRDELTVFNEDQMVKGFLPRAGGIERAGVKLSLREAGAEHQRVLKRIGELGRELGIGGHKDFLVRALYDVVGKEQAQQVLSRAKELRLECVELA